MASPSTSESNGGALANRTPAEVVDEGIEDGDLRDVDAESVAAFLVGAVEAARMRKITLGRDDASDRCWETLADVVVPELLA